jgi:hypothetical protein
LLQSVIEMAFLFEYCDIHNFLYYKQLGHLCIKNP